MVAVCVLGPRTSASTQSESTPVLNGDPSVKRQREILDLAATGATDAEIAQALGISLPTVRSHLTRLYLANGLRNRTEAIAEWIRAKGMAGT